MSSQQYERGVQQSLTDIAKLESKRASVAGAEANYRSSATRALAGITKSTPPSTAASKMRDADSKIRSADRERDKAVDLQKQIARKQSDLAAAQKSLVAEIEKEDRERLRRDKRTADDERRRTRDQERSAAEALRSRDRQIEALRGEVTALNGGLAKVSEALARELPARLTVLVLFSDPSGTLRLDREMREIHNVIRLSEKRDHVRVESRWAARPEDLSQAILDTRPQVVHFSGHGDDRSGLVFEGDDGEPRVINPVDLVGLVRAIGQSVRVILYNACWSGEAATAMAERVQVAIGMDAPVTDDGARAFAAGFYRAVGSGQSVQAAFEVGRFELRNTPAYRELEAEPVLEHRTDINPDSLFLVAPASSLDTPGG